MTDENKKFGESKDLVLPTGKVDNAAPLATYPLANPVVEDALSLKIDQRSYAYERLLAAAIAATKPTDWVNMGGKAYLQSSGAEKVGVRFGVSAYGFKEQREDFEDDAGKYYLYTITGTVSFGDQTIECVGTCSSRDKFFGTRNGKLKPTSEIDVANIKKKAYTNCYGNGVRRLLALNNITWDVLQGKIRNIDKAPSYDFDKKPAPQQIAPPQQAQVSVPPEKTTPTPTPKQTSKTRGNMPFWFYEGDRGGMILCIAGRHYPKEYLTNLDFVESAKKPGTYYVNFTQSIWDKLEKDYQEFENKNKVPF